MQSKLGRPNASHSYFPCSSFAPLLVNKVNSVERLSCLLIGIVFACVCVLYVRSCQESDGAKQLEKHKGNEAMKKRNH